MPAKRSKFRHYGSSQVAPEPISAATPFVKGTKVRVHINKELRLGMVKRVNFTDEIVWVVTDCANNWKNFDAYSAYPIHASDVMLGWE